MMQAKKSLYSEIKTGGQYARRTPVVGEFVGDSQVIACIGIRGKDSIWSTLCSCGSMQIRTSGQINNALRNHRSLPCPQCHKEHRGGEYSYRRDQRCLARLHRVLEGGPIWAHYETAELQQQVLSDLEEEFGCLDDKLSIEEMQIANGWPGDNTPPKKPQAVEEYWFNDSTYRPPPAKPTKRDEMIEARARVNKKMRDAAREKELAEAKTSLQAERWNQVINGVDIYNPDKVTKKSVTEYLREMLAAIDDAKAKI